MTHATQSAPTFTKRYVLHGKFEYHPLTVKSRREITPLLVRITLQGPNVKKLHFLSPDDDVRIVVPLDLYAVPGEMRVEYEPEYRVHYPEDAPPYEIKAYTIRRFDAEAEEMDVEVAIHASGHGVVWAKDSQPGQTVLVAGAWGSFAYDGPMDSIVLFGDETALPAIQHWIESLQAPTSATIIAEVANEQEHIPFAAPDGVHATIHWIHREGAAPGRNNLLMQAVQEHARLMPNCLYWGAGESSTLRDIRRYLVNDLGVHRKAIQMSGYWKREDDPEEWFIDEDRTLGKK